MKGNLLYYQERPGDRNLLGVIVLEGCMVQACETDGQFCFSLVFTGPGLRTYRLAADDHLSQENWVSALLCASHLYLSMIVKDLERCYKGECFQNVYRLENSNGYLIVICFVSAVHSTEARKEKGLCDLIQTEETSDNTMASRNTGHVYFGHGASVVPRDGRSYSTGSVLPSSTTNRPISYSLQAPPVSFKTNNKRSPKLWPKRNAHVTPLNSPAPSYGEWPVVGFDPLEEFSKLHEYYGNEIKELRADWLKKKREEVGYIEEDLIDLG